MVTLIIVLCARRGLVNLVFAAGLVGFSLASSIVGQSAAEDTTVDFDDGC
jgi:hypothetical protein